MGEEFEGRDLSGAVFWGVDLSRATFRDVDLSGVQISHARIVDVEIDGLVDRLIVNGVDVTEHVNAGDPWYPLRAMLQPEDADEAVRSWAVLQTAWDDVITRAEGLGDAALSTSVDGEWSLDQTLRHLVFAMDKWFVLPVLGADGFHPIGLPNSGSADLPWPGLDPSAEPTHAEIRAVRIDRSERFGAFLARLTTVDLDRQIDVLENGRVTVRDGVFTVFEEEFEHLRYVVRDLDRLDG